MIHSLAQPSHQRPQRKQQRLHPHFHCHHRHIPPTILHHVLPHHHRLTIGLLGGSYSTSSGDLSLCMAAS
jgi:hypothetical protein